MELFEESEQSHRQTEGRMHELEEEIHSNYS